MDTTFVLQTGQQRLSRRGLIAALTVVAAVGIVFVAAVALPYLNVTEAQFGRYWTRRWGLLLHVAAGVVALLSSG